MLVRATHQARIFRLDLMARSMVPRYCHLRSVLSRLPSLRPSSSFQPVNGSSLSDSPTRTGDYSQRSGVPSGSRTANTQEVSLFNSTLVAAHAAIERRDPNGFCQAWDDFQRYNLLDFLGASKLDEFARFAREFWETTDPRNKRPKRFGDVIVVAAVHGAPNILAQCMVTILQNGHPDMVLQLYDQYAELATAKGEAWLEEGLTESLSDDELDSGSLADDMEDDMLDQMTSSGGTLQIRLSMIAAHAAEGTFTECLDKCLKFRSSFGPYLTQGFLKQFQNHSKIHDSLEDYVRRINTATSAADSLLLTRRIQAYGTEQNLTGLHNLYENILAGFSAKHGAFLTADPSDVRSDGPILIPETVWRSFIAAFLHCGEVRQVSKLWKDLEAVGVVPGIQMINAVLDGLRETQSLEEIERVWRLFRLKGLQPDALSYRALVNVHFRAGRPELALQYFQEFLSSPAYRQSEPRAIMTVYNSVLHGLLTNGQEKEATAMLKVMSQQGPKPDLVSYNTFMRHHGQRGELKMLADILRAIQASSLTPDGTTFTTVLSALVKAGTKDSARRVIGIMQAMDIPQNVITFSTILDGIVRQGGTSLKDALEFLAHMETLEEAKPNVVTYTSVLAGFLRDQQISPQEMEECTQWILKRMAANNIRPNRTTYGFLLRACLENRTPAGIEYFLRYYREMVKNRIVLNHKTCYLILKTLVSRKEWAIGAEIVKELRRSGFQAPGYIQVLVHSIWRNFGRLSP